MLTNCLNNCVAHMSIQIYSTMWPLVTSNPSEHAIYVEDIVHDWEKRV